MKRRAHVVLVRIGVLSLGLGGAACGSGPDPSLGGAVVGVEVDPSDTGGGAYTEGVALGSNAVFAAFSGDLVRLAFDGSGSHAGMFDENGAVLELAVAAGDGSVWWAAGGGDGTACTTEMGSPQMTLWTGSDAAFSTITAAAAPAAVACSTNAVAGMSGQPTIYGLVADDTWVVAAIASSSVSSSPDQQDWPGGGGVTPAPSGGASLLRFDRGALSATPQPLEGVSLLATALTSHVLAQSTQEVYWLDASSAGADRVMRASKSGWSSGEVVATAPSDTLTGIAASDAYVAWATSSQPQVGAAGCAVFASQADGPPAKIYDGSSAPFLCWGMAVDDTYAYFATTTVVEPADDPGGAYMEGTGIGRVPLAGGPLQTVPLASSRWYGARRVLVDAQYVYAIDPSFVVRVDKSAFGG